MGELMGKHEKRCIDIETVNEFDIDVKVLNLNDRDDIFFRIYVLKNNDWNEFEKWIEYTSKIRKKRDLEFEKSRMTNIYESIKNNGYVYNHKGGRDNSITVINLNNKYNLLNGSCRMASIILNNIRRIRVREVSNTIEYCCRRAEGIRKSFNINDGKMIINLSKNVKEWIVNYKNGFLND